MDPKVLAEKYMNIMALALSLISRFKINVSEIRAYRNYSIIAERQKTILDSLWEAKMILLMLLMRRWKRYNRYKVT